MRRLLSLTKGSFGRFARAMPHKRRGPRRLLPNVITSGSIQRRVLQFLSTSATLAHADAMVDASAPFAANVDNWVIRYFTVKSVKTQRKDTDKNEKVRRTTALLFACLLVLVRVPALF